MPRRPYKQKQKRPGGGLDADQLMHLLHGWCLDNMYHPYFKENQDLQFPFKDEAHRRALYFEHKAYLFSLAGRGHVDGLFADLKADEKPRPYCDYEVPEIPK